MSTTDNDTTCSKEEKDSCDYTMPTTQTHELKNDAAPAVIQDGDTHEEKSTSSWSDTSDLEDIAQSPNEEDTSQGDCSQEDINNGEVQVNKESNTTKPGHVFHPSLQHSDSLVISEIDSQNESDISMNDSEKIGELLATIANATKEVKEKRQKLKQEDCHPEEVSTTASTTATRTTPSPSQHIEEAFTRARSTETQDSGMEESNVSPTQYQQQPQPQPQFQNPYVDVNTPIMMVPSQHLLQQMQVQQMQQQVQQMQMNFIPHQNNPNSGLSSPMYTTATPHALPHPPHAARNVNPVMVHTPSTQNHGRRKMNLRLVEDIHTTMDHNNNEGSKKSIFSRLARRTRTMSIGSHDGDENNNDNQEEAMDGSPHRLKTTQKHGEIAISWYDGTSAMELQDHVRKSVETKLRIGRKKLLLNLCMIDESVEPPEEIVLSPYIPDGSSFLLTFRIKDLTKKWETHINHHRAPPSPSNPPRGLEQELQKQISDVLSSEKSHRRSATSPSRLQVPDISAEGRSMKLNQRNPDTPPVDTQVAPQSKTNDILSQRLEKLNDTLLLLNDEGGWAKEDPNQLKTEKKQVIFVIANYFVLFLSLIAISAEIHERAPEWMAWVDSNITTVQNCATDKDALFQCVSEGNFSGLVASVVLWATQSVATKRFFLFGFDSPKKLWRVVYECCVSSFCWAFSYIFIRRGLNPDTRPNCVRKYWKDAVYGGLAGFNATFMKAVLKNFLPQADEILDVMEHRQVHLFSVLGSFFKPDPGILSHPSLGNP